MDYGLIGERLGHSYSPQIHALLGNDRYELRPIPLEELDAFLRARNFKGLNVTIPYKQAVLPYCAQLSDTAREIGSVNTLVVRPDGSLLGHNTDIGGFTTMLREAGIDPSGKKAVVLGSGGTSLTARTALKHMGAREIVVVSRRGPVTYDALYAEHADAQLLVNATPVGMYPHTGVSPVELDRLPNLTGVADVIYNPEKTALILDAQARGIPAVSGLTMLVAQAREADEWFFGRPVSGEVVRTICGEIRAEMLNLVLVGMPGCGKSTLGAQVAALLGRPFVDCDEEIVREAGMSIPEIFARFGEADFRRREAEVLRRVGRESGTVVATGGGAILREDNVRALRQNGRICFLRRALEQLPTDGRPLSGPDDAIARLWRERREKYERCADFTVDNDSSAEAVARRIQEGFHEAAHR